MIVRISGRGQFDLDDDATRQLDALDDTLTAALHAGEDEPFHRALAATIEYVCSHGTELAHDRVVPSDVIVPPDDISLSEAQQFFTDEGLMSPLPA